MVGLASPPAGTSACDGPEPVEGRDGERECVLRPRVLQRNPTGRDLSPEGRGEGRERGGGGRKRKHVRVGERERECKPEQAIQKVGKDHLCSGRLAGLSGPRPGCQESTLPLH